MTDCLALLNQHPEARIVAGATDLAVEANLRGRRWPMFVSVEALPELKIFTEADDAVEIGAGLTLSEIEERWTSAAAAQAGSPAPHAPAALREWFELFASPLIRNRATLGGNLATASPVGDAAPLLLAMDAQLRIAGTAGTRLIPLRDFFLGYRHTALASGEIIVSVRIPKPLPSRLAFYKAAKRVMDDISTVSATFAIDLDSAGRVTRCRAAYGGVAATPVLVAAFEHATIGGVWSETTLRRAQQAVAVSLAPIGDHRGSGRLSPGRWRNRSSRNSGSKRWRRGPHESRRSRAAA